MTFEVIASKLQDELIGVIQSGKEVNDYELIVYKYVFISELGLPLHEELGIEMDDDSFILFIVPDGLKFSILKDLSDAFSRFEITFMASSYGLIKLKFTLLG